MIRSHKIRLNPNNKQQNYFCQACGVSRFTWNWALTPLIATYQKNGSSYMGHLLRFSPHPTPFGVGFVVQLVSAPLYESHFFGRTQSGVSRWNELNKEGKTTSGFSLKKGFNGLKGTHFPWVYNVTKYASQQPFIHIQKAFRAFFEKKAKYPKF